MKPAGSHLDDAARLAVCALGHQPRTVLDIGAGDGELLVCLAGLGSTAHLLGIELDETRRTRAEERLAASAPPGGYRVLAGDATRQPIPRADLACVNPPMLPGELGFADARARSLFWQTILRRLAHERFADVLLLHLFGFHGITGPTGPFEPLTSVVDDCLLDAACIYAGRRRIAEHSRIRTALPALRRCFPAGTIYVGQAPTPLAAIAPAPSCPLAIDHYIFEIRPAISEHRAGEPARIGTLAA